MTEDFKDFDLLNVPLKGTSLVEASAGTGKSFSIAGLFLRFLIETPIPVSEILVVTFTQAATEELRDRIRRSITDALEAFSEGGSRESFLQGLVEKEKDHGEAINRLNAALRNFDCAAIMTIHGFCWRILKENAFESLSMFDVELVSSQELIKAEMVDDFWRQHLYTESALFVQYAVQVGLSPDSLLKLLGKHLSRPFLKVIPAVESPDASAQEQAFIKAFETLRSAWPSAREQVAGLLRSDSLKRNCYNLGKLPAWIESMDDFLSRPGAESTLFSGFEKFTTTELCRSAKKNCEPPAHAFFDLCESFCCSHAALLEHYEEKIIGLKSELFRFANRELPARKGKMNVLYFDDLLLNLLGALQGKAGEQLAATIRGKFKAALIDEFQDTDPLQYTILREVFARKPSILFFIGDPKQSIYGFRGADIFAYMEAARDVQTRFTLRENWRSEPDLVTSLNVLFENNPRPFVYEEIRFHPCAPAHGRASERLLINGKPEPPFHMWIVESDSDAPKAIPKQEARRSISAAVAGEIAELLRLGKEGRALLGGRPLGEEDIAVLVRRNQDAVQMQQVLSGLGIPSVLYSTGNLFDSHEAMEVQRVLSSIAAPENGKLLRGALVTDILGLNGADLEKVISEEREWESWVVRFTHYRDLWVGRGFIRMFRRFLNQEEVLARLMRYPDGERRCTNLLHLSEVLHQISVDKRLSRAGLLKWLAAHRAGVGTEPEEHPIRLESDERAVKLVTVHKSKGLEYPVVFCPFGWNGSTLRSSREPFSFHDGATPAGLTLELGSEHAEENRKQAEKENLSENLRLLYVSLTRAKERCYFVWGRFRDAETSAPAYLFYPPPSLAKDDVVAATRNHFLKLEKNFTEKLQELERKAGGGLVIYPVPEFPVKAQVPEQRESAHLSCRVFKGHIDREQGFASFSSLISGREAEPEDGDPEATLKETTPLEKPQGFFSFPAGMRAGSFLHALFEDLDFTSRDSGSIKKMIGEKLIEHGYDPEWREEVHGMVKRVLQADLDPTVPDLRLSRLGAEDRLQELEFYWPLRRVTPGSLAEIVSGRDIPAGFAEHLGRLEFSPLRGFMRGFLDLLFRFRGRYYLVDWKSNDLGARIEDYGRAGMMAAMQKGYYVLQYLIYTVAVHQYLRLRLPDYRYEDHFGGVFYIFLRGVDPDRGPDFGIFRARPSEELVRKLAAGLIEDKKPN
ncbi:MAG: exodeoxyribonuclease V subunit beta [Desulfobacterales bacterium]|nr:exodeoxyribonuclease V subunit beta [Desulfobacterales bacterium]